MSEDVKKNLGQGFEDAAVCPVSEGRTRADTPVRYKLDEGAENPFADFKDRVDETVKTVLGIAT